MKKTFFTLFAFIALLPLNAQEIYKPVFDEETTFYCALTYGSWDICQSEIFVCQKDMENKNVYHIMFSSIFFEVSEDNSKLWLINNDYPTPQTDLIMDLNLNEGDKFKDFTVAKVYLKDGRKHIEFAMEGEPYAIPPYDGFTDQYYILNKLEMCKDGNPITFSEYPLTFVEGVGPNAIFNENLGVWIYAKYKNEELEYAIEGLYPVVEYFRHHEWCYWCEYYASCETTGVKDPGIRTLSLVPNPTGNNVQVILPENIRGKAILTVSDLSGRVIETVVINSNSFVLDISHYAPAIYIAKIDTGSFQYMGKIIKK